VNDRLGDLQTRLSGFGGQCLGDLAEPGDHGQQVVQWPHALDGLKLLGEILQRKTGGAQLFLHAARLFFAVCGLGALDKGEHVTHPQNTRGQSVGVKDL